MLGDESDLERYAKVTSRADLQKELARGLRESMQQRLPCSYSGGDCVVSYLAQGGNDDSPFMAAFCLKAKSITRGMFTNIERRLSEAGCPEPRSGLFNFRCKYADGQPHRLA